ncbi:MAG: glycine--tRNA ligase subunit beta [Succinatimonas sp.]|jgi:glycyl-tRNA synthetase beta chain|nr:glycine--tRNA ligase subunit beta [Succinatimonas sp.]MDY5722711.1 glycine--tRNA ligase subunit beta [Succinivibrio sp.]
MTNKNLLLELGTEELPPKSLRNLAQSLHDSFVKQLKDEGLEFASSKWYATPRRLALFIEGLADKQEDKEVEIKGPAVKAAFDAEGNPTKAALGWANANGISIDQAQRLETPKGAWLYIKTLKKGKQAVEVVPEMFKNALKALPIPRLMHWGAKREEFVRPVHTLCMLFGDELINGSILGVESSKTINGHRFLGQQKVTINSADSYVEQLRNEGSVVADYDERKASIIKQVTDIANSVNGVADLDDALVEEVTSIVEEPHIFKATFEERFLKVPAEALVYTMKGDQKYFPIYDKEGKLLPVFAFASNINPKDPTSLVSGNERVVRPRLSDAEFFFNTDRKHSLESLFERLETIVYQKDIGTIAFRSNCVEKLAKYIASLIGADETKAARAAHLAKCDLASTMVTEFTDTQGVMGMHYAELDGEDPDVAQAIFEQYCPRFAGDKIPTKGVEIAVSLAEKIITLVGIFGINMLPKGDKDPFGLRRAAIGLVRIVLENNLSFNFVKVIEEACNILDDKVKAKDTKDQVVNFVYNRLKAYYQDQNIEASIFLAVLSTAPVDLLDFDKRVKAVKSFKDLPAAENLASAYKRVNNILSKATVSEGNVDKALLSEDAEKALSTALDTVSPKVNNLYTQGDYTQALATLSELKEPVDNFFDKVMVNADDPKVKENRLHLLQQLHNLIGKTADISVLY